MVTTPCYNPPIEPTLARFFDALDAQASVSAQTVYACHRDLSEFAAFMAGRGRPLSQASEADITAFVLKIQGNPGAARRLRSIRLYCRFLIRAQVLSADPAAGVTVPGTLPHFSHLEHRAIKLPVSVLGILVMTGYLQLPWLLATALVAAGWILEILALPVSPRDRSTDGLTWSA